MTTAKTTFTTQARPGMYRIVWIDVLGMTWTIKELYEAGATELDEPNKRVGDYAPLKFALEEQARLNAECEAQGLDLTGNYCLFDDAGAMVRDDANAIIDFFGSRAPMG